MDNLRHYVFQDDLELGILYEQKFCKTLSHPQQMHGYFPDYDVIDKATNRTYEIKRDRWYQTTGNILIEEYYNLETLQPGWIYYSKADYLVVYVSETDYYICSMATVKQEFINRRELWTVKDIIQDSGFITRNWVRPLDTVIFKARFHSALNENTSTEVSDWM